LRTRLKADHIQRVADIWLLSSSRCDGRSCRAAGKCGHCVKCRLYRGEDVVNFVRRLTQTHTHTTVVEGLSKFLMISYEK